MQGIDARTWAPGYLATSARADWRVSVVRKSIAAVYRQMVSEAYDTTCPKVLLGSVQTSRIAMAPVWVPMVFGAVLARWSFR